MADSDAEWVGVDFEFGKPDTSPTTARPQPTLRPTIRPQPPPPPRPTPQPRPPAIEPPQDASEMDGRVNPKTNSVGIVAGSVGGVLGVLMILLVVYMLVLRRKLSKAKDSGKASKYQLRVEDVSHITNLDETSNTYVNTTDLQKLVASVRAKGKSADRVPLPPKTQQQTPKPCRPLPVDQGSGTTPRGGHVENSGYKGSGDVVVVRPPAPAPHKSPVSPLVSVEASEPDVIYCNLDPTVPPPLPSPAPNTTTTVPPSRSTRVEAPKIAPPPPPAQLKNRVALNQSGSNPPLSPTAIARPAPPPPTVGKTRPQQAAVITPSALHPPSAPHTKKPTPPPVALKPNKVVESAPAGPAPTIPKPTPPTLPKPGVLKKGKGLPPLKMALLPSLTRTSLDNASTPDTAIFELTPDSTPTADDGTGPGSISAKIAFLEGKMKTPGNPSRPAGPRT
ncbi:extensin-like [Homarus americanus]|uniref:Uncharacterized protein n=1 Tax=Homarus americanus TaxID=6706 RepID=A0A8J5K381_HOMAM|nr:extensin-like [Homarus americanus]KAG7166210.1 hypothetical protein Hamer_G011032 [Homarus americanus]